MLNSRILTALILIILLVLVLLLPPISFNLVVWGVSLVTADEFLRLFHEFRDNKWRWSVLSFLLLGEVTCELMPVQSLLVLSVIWWLVVVPMLLWQYSKIRKISCTRLTIIGMLFIIFVPAGVSINKIFHDYGRVALLYFLSGVWANDIGAYFVGLKFGKTPLALSISPRKTKEGFWGGLALSVFWSSLLGTIMSYLEFIPSVFIRKPCLMLSLFIVCGAVACLGDLFESMLKRRANVKDSGAFLPGHGGWLDRLDSTLAVMPVLMLGLMFIS